MDKLSYYRNKIITGEKVFLKKIKKNNLNTCIKWLEDPEVNKFLSQSIKNVNHLQELEWYRSIRNSEEDLVFTINTKTDSVYIGNCGLHKINLEKKYCEFGIFIGNRAYWNKGFGTDAIMTVLNFATEVLGINSINLVVYEYNHRAISTYEKCGFVRTGTLEKYHLYNNVCWDAYLMEYKKALNGMK